VCDLSFPLVLSFVLSPLLTYPHMQPFPWQDDDVDFQELERLEANLNLRATAPTVAVTVGSASGKENAYAVSTGPTGTKSAWKPPDQPTWRGGAATIWERPATVEVGRPVPVANAARNQRLNLQEEDPYRGWSSPSALRGGQEGVGPSGNALSTKTDAPRANSDGVIPANWFESSDDEDVGNLADQCMNGGAGYNGGGPRLPPFAPGNSDQLHPTRRAASNANRMREELTKDSEMFEDWLYEKRPVLQGTPVQDLASCSTTTGGIRVCRNAARHWVYPAHIPERKYQLYAIYRALFSNTLVCYPTGLGKTLIAAVVMHNFFRWFPESKVVFIAPTKPLVAQQMKACQTFMGLDESAIYEMTGKASGENRKVAWNDDAVRVYFCTPQAFWNDVKRGICPYDLISCVVVDECHRATGQADIVKAVKDMRNVKKCKFRVLGLSATPGSSHEQVQEVIDSLGISTLVFKDEMDKDVAPYVHNKRSEVVVVNPDCAGNASRCMLMAALQRIVGDLSSKGHYYGVADAERVTRFAMQNAKKACKKPTWAISGQFLQAQILADLRDQLDGYGTKTALSFLQCKMVQEKHLKSLHSSDPQFAHFVASLQRAQGPNPKLEKLKQILHEFFTSDPIGSAGAVGPLAIRRAIIFASLRDGVASIADALETMSPLVRAKMFIGQGGGGKGQTGMKQSEQKQVLADFSTGACNLLVATCIGEEGLDIPNVDLIVCFDAISSPTRALQRQGRTGRHGDGRVIYLVTAGQEEDRFNKSASAMKKLHAQLKEAEQFFTLNENAVRMLPREFGIPKMAHLVQDNEINATDLRCNVTDVTDVMGKAAVAQMATSAKRLNPVPAAPGTAVHVTSHVTHNVVNQARPDVTPHVAPYVTPERLTSAVDLVSNGDNSVDIGNETPLTRGSAVEFDLPADVKVLEEMPLMERLELVKAHTANAGATAKLRRDVRRRYRQIISSQSTLGASQSPAISLPAPGGGSSRSMENLSIKRSATPQQLSRLYRAGDQKSVVSKIDKKPRFVIENKAEDGAGRGDDLGCGLGDGLAKRAGRRGKPAKKSRLKKPCEFIDEEVSLTGDDSGDEGEDLVENPSLQAFFDDATQEGSPVIYGAVGHAYGGHEESPDVMNVLERVRFKRQQFHLMMDTQSQELSRATPDEYDLDDSFLADSDE
jgi:ERCC4-related helicase